MTTVEDAPVVVDASDRPLGGACGEPPDSYPQDLVRNVVTAEGLGYSVRPIRPDDANLLVAFHSHLSTGSCYFRFFSYHPVLSDGEVERFTHVDYDSRVALVAVSDDQIIGVGRYDRLGGTADAEVAFVIADEFQRHGIGSLLLDQLVEVARAHGITTFVADTLCENRKMLDVFIHCGFPVSQETKYGTVYLRFPIAATPSARLAVAMRNATREVTGSS